MLETDESLAESQSAPREPQEGLCRKAQYSKVESELPRQTGDVFDQSVVAVQCGLSCLGMWFCARGFSSH